MQVRYYDVDVDVVDVDVIVDVVVRDFNQILFQARAKSTRTSFYN